MTTTRSMTGFAHVRRPSPFGEIVVTLKSVNHRGLDLRFNMPAALDPFESVARDLIRRSVQRGHLQAHVSVNREHSGNAGALNIALLEQWLKAYRQAAELIGSDMPPDPHVALRQPGMLEGDAGMPWSDELLEELTPAFCKAIADLNEFREREGGAIASEVRDRTRAVDDLADRMDNIRKVANPAFHKRLKEKLSELLRGATVEPQRLAQEAAILADRSDVSEEIMRLRVHAGEMIALLDTPDEKGKKLDFLLQEMNRESNTILSKTGGLGEQGLTLTNLALAAKAEIDKMREQALNLE